MEEGFTWNDNELPLVLRVHSRHSRRQRTRGPKLSNVLRIGFRIVRPMFRCQSMNRVSNQTGAEAEARQSSDLALDDDKPVRFPGCAARDSGRKDKSCVYQRSTSHKVQIREYSSHAIT